MAGRLQTYRRKRDFQVTPEPPPGGEHGEPSVGARFVVHKHDATRLHYDLRLEIDGALASWAIPKGPSYDPAQKRLAVQTEDHPLAYAEFEGRIPDGEYGAGDSLIWDRGTWRTDPPGQERAQRDKGHLRVVLAGQKLTGLWHLVRTRRAGEKQQWLLFKADDEEADPDYDVVGARPESVVSGRRATRGPVSSRRLRALHPPPVDLLLRVWPPMRAVPSLPESLGPGPWVFEVDYEGARALASLAGGRVALQSRAGHDLAARFAVVAARLLAIKVGEAVVDGVVVGRGERPSDPADAFVGFDLLWLEGQDLRERPLEERRDLLESLFSNLGPGLGLAERVPGEVARALRHARGQRWAGLVAKRAASRYRAGPSRDWQELRLRPAQDVVVVGYQPCPGTRGQVGALLVAVRERGRLRYAGRVTAGLDRESAALLGGLLEPLRGEAAPLADAPRLRSARWTEARQVVQVDFAGWTEANRLLRPSFRRLRPDKGPEDCRRVAWPPVSAPRRRRG